MTINKGKILMEGGSISQGLIFSPRGASLSWGGGSDCEGGGFYKLGMVFSFTLSFQARHKLHGVPGNVPD